MVHVDFLELEEDQAFDEGLDLEFGLDAAEDGADAAWEAAPQTDGGPGRPPEDLRGELSAFLEAFPEVKGEEILPEVWREAAAGKNLTLAYSLHRNQTLERELAAREQAEHNRRRSTGSLARHAPGTAEDLIAAWWNEA